MANKHFVVHNGLTVGPLEIDATTGNLTTQGSLSVAGDLDVIGNISISGDLGVSQISKNDSSISINDTGIESTVVIAIDGTTAATIDADGVKLSSGDALFINGASVLSASELGPNVITSNLATVGTLTTLDVSGDVQTDGNIYANSNVATTSTDTGAVVVAGGVGISGGLQTGADIYIAGSIAATVDDAAALAVALG